MKYAKTRNYGDGAVTKLSPYISRGVISTRQVYEHIITRERPWNEIEKLVQELAWRDYWQLVWISKGDDIHTDLKQAQTPVSNFEIPAAVMQANTSIKIIDESIKQLYDSGYMHNHMRMYVASICCNVANSHWLNPSRWMYANLLDGDLASNQLSWQWVAGAFSKKKYFANQDNINHFFKGSQENTFLDFDYPDLTTNDTPDILTDTQPFNVETPLPNSTTSTVILDQDSLVYNYYNLDPNWHKGESFQRILLIEPSIFKQYPVNSNCINFALELSNNISDLKVFVGEFEELQQNIKTGQIHFKEHPLNKHYSGIEEARDWMTNLEGYYPSFFAFWKRAKKQLQV